MATSSESKKKRKGETPRPAPKSSPNTNPSTNEQEEAAAPSSHDRISSLPDEMLTSVIALLPLNDAARTSVLSTRWRRLWTLAPLHIDMKDVYPGYLRLRNPKRRKILCCLDAVNHILSGHRGPIRSFRLSLDARISRFGDDLLYPPGPTRQRIDRAVGSWAKTLARIHRGIQDLSLPCKLPSEFLACESLTSLELVDCDPFDQVLALPPNLRDLKLGQCVLLQCYIRYTKLPTALFDCRYLRSLQLSCFNLDKSLERPLPPNLREVTLRNTYFNQSTLSQVLSGCLDALCLDQCSFAGSIMYIRSPSLQRLYLPSLNIPKTEIYLVIEDAPNLELLKFGKGLTEYMNVKVASTPKLQVLGILSFSGRCVRLLEFGDTIFQAGILTKFDTLVYSLKTLIVHVDVDEVSQAKVVPDLLKCFPFLEKLDVVIECWPPFDPAQDEEFQIAEILSGCLDHHLNLKVVNLKGFLGRPGDVGLAKFLIRSARSLKVMSLLCSFEVKESWKETLKHELIDQNSASSDLQVVFDRDCPDHT